MQLVARHAALSPMPTRAGVQVWDAGQDAGNVGHMVRARLDVPRFVQLNSAKGRWALLDDLGTTSLEATVAAATPDAALMQAGGREAVTARPAVQMDAVIRIVHEVAAGIVSNEQLEGEGAVVYCAQSVADVR